MLKTGGLPAAAVVVRILYRCVCPADTVLVSGGRLAAGRADRIRDAWALEGRNTLAGGVVCGLRAYAFFVFQAFAPAYANFFTHAAVELV